MMDKNKEIKVLSEIEHLRLRPSIMIGSVKPTDEKIPIIRDKFIYFESRKISVGLYKLFNEVFDNALDEAKRMKGSMKSISISVDTKKNSISIGDTGNGFYKGTNINTKSGKSNIETALTMLRAGSNFDNHEFDESIIGQNGVGVSCVWGLSKKFHVISINSTHRYEQTWENDVRSEPIITPNDGSLKKGTIISFQPIGEIFGNSKWDIEILRTTLIFKLRLIKKDPLINKLSLEFYVDGKKIDLDITLQPKKSFSIETPIGEVIIWEKYEGSGSISFVNSAICSGIHQRIVNEFINAKLDDNLGHHFYDTFISLNLQPKLVNFGDQNKTRFITPREEVEPTISRTVLSKLGAFFKTELFASIQAKVEERKNDGHVKKLRAEKRKVNVKNSHKYFPASKSSAENLFIVEGLSAMGSILQKRNPEKDGIYALKGKIKNCRNLGDLSENKEILELMQILNLDPTVKNSQMISGYSRIIIATDADPDGSHITSLIINLFYKWFPWVILNGQLTILKTPLVSVGDKSKRKYYFDLEEFKLAKTSGNIRYLKGLGSLDVADWEYVMSNKDLTSVVNDSKAKEYLDMAFGDVSQQRKDWLKTGILKK